ncbi:MAG: hypothetical protein AAGB04_31495 [Pseudomonadota bacterium]
MDDALLAIGVALTLIDWFNQAHRAEAVLDTTREFLLGLLRRILKYLEWAIIRNMVLTIIAAVVVGVFYGFAGAVYGFGYAGELFDLISESEILIVIGHGYLPFFVSLTILLPVLLAIFASGLFTIILPIWVLLLPISLVMRLLDHPKKGTLATLGLS